MAAEQGFVTESARERRRDSGSKDAPEAVVLHPRLSERIWGVTELPQFLDQPKPGHPVGEAWLTAVDCVAEDESAMTLGELTRHWPEAFGTERPGEFPLLMKFLFPKEKLSVQVHPNDAEAQAIGQPCGKNECWYVLSAEPGAEIALGLREEITTLAIEEAIHEGKLESKLQYVPVKAGDMVYVEAGTIHAIGPGMVILETQQYSDTTYRLYDYGRPRELHLEQGLAVTKSRTASGLVAPVEQEGFTRLITSPYFSMDRFTLAKGTDRSLGLNQQMQILLALDEGAAVCLDFGRSIPLPAGRAVILPAKTEADRHLQGSKAVEVIRVTAT